LWQVALGGDALKTKLTTVGQAWLSSASSFLRTSTGAAAGAQPGTH
jgi:hypothetical protein